MTYILNLAYTKSYQDTIKQRLIENDIASVKISPKNKENIRDYTGRIIGKCENILIFIFIIFDQYTALALIFTAKTIVRAESIRADPLYYLAGTMVNVTYSIIITLLVKYLLNIF